MYMAAMFSEITDGNYVTTMRDKPLFEVIPITDARSVYDARCTATKFLAACIWSLHAFPCCLADCKLPQLTQLLLCLTLVTAGTEVRQAKDDCAELFAHIYAES